MKILLTAHYAEQYRGTEMFNWTLAKYLSREHEVSFFTYVKGIGSDKIGQFAKIVDKPYEDKWDLLIGSHNSCFEEVRGYCRKAAFISHGVQRSLDVPPEDCAKFAVSEEVRAKHNCQFIIRNPVDFERFYPEGKSDKPIYLNAEPQKNIIEASKQFGVEVVGENGREWEVEKKVRRARFVLSGARGVLEAMACKTPAIVVSRFGLDGYCGEFNELKDCNFSGRRYHKGISEKSLAYVVGKINDKDTENCYQWVKENCDPLKVIKTIMENTL